MLKENKVHTLEEVADHLRVPEDAIRNEVVMGHLPALNIAGHIRITDEALRAYLKPSVLNQSAIQERADGAQELKIQLAPAADFDQRWPAKQGENREREHYTQVQEGIAS